ncbi:MAG: hypothetical protein K1060chlam5_01040 [Candidatus Anoxychlamydiales bacterium]|nr:hypothetical protein [Candidatus Anoxychlamydiales bacterium]
MSIASRAAKVVGFSLLAYAALKIKTPPPPVTQAIAIPFENLAEVALAQKTSTATLKEKQVKSYPLIGKDYVLDKVSEFEESLLNDPYECESDADYFED